MQLRKVTPADRAQILQVEALSTPNLHYLDAVYDLFQHDDGEFMLVEEAGAVLGCAKFSVLPDGSAWLEALRVRPEVQGRGLGKRMYERFFELARERGIRTMRMYTGIENHASRGLAEHFGFRLEETFTGFTRPPGEVRAAREVLTPVTDAGQAEALLLATQADWGDFLVLNRTFYRLTPELCRALAAQGMVYARAGSASESEAVAVLGARFSPEKALHLGLFHGDSGATIAFATGQQGQRWGASSRLQRRSSARPCCSPGSGRMPASTS